MRISPKSGGQQHSIQMISRDSSIRMLMLDVLLVSIKYFAVVDGIGLVLTTIPDYNVLCQKRPESYNELKRTHWARLPSLGRLRAAQTAAFYRKPAKAVVVLNLIHILVKPSKGTEQRQPKIKAGFGHSMPRHLIDLKFLFRVLSSNLELPSPSKIPVVIITPAYFGQIPELHTIIQTEE